MTGKMSIVRFLSSYAQYQYICTDKRYPLQSGTSSLSVEAPELALAKVCVRPRPIYVS